jgi:dephospho-CoA kinase
VVTERLRARGVAVVDADQVAHDVTAPGTPAYQALRDAFGDAILTSTREIDRPFLAAVVFHDAWALRRLNRITHGPIGEEILRRLATLEAPVAVVALPLFRPEHRETFGFTQVWAVQVPEDLAVRRLVDGRGYREDEARARLAAQVTNDERETMVDRVLWNTGTLDELYRAVDELVVESGITSG